MQTDRRVHVYVLGFFVAMIMAPSLIQAISEIRSGAQPQAIDIFLQPPTAKNLRSYQQAMEKTSFVIQEFRPWSQYFQWKVFGSAGEEVVAGRRGWLFYRTSVRYLVESSSGLSRIDFGDPLVAIQSFQDQLRAQGIRLLVVPVPGKESVYPEMLVGRAEGAGVVVCDQTQRLLDQLWQSGIECVDLFEVFRQAKLEASQGRSSRRPLFLAHDSHWSPEGARVAAVAVARQVLDGGTVTQGVHGYRQRPVAVRHQGDLVEMLRSPQIERVIEPESMACSQVVDTETGKPYRDATDSQILILGDSFLRIYQQDEPGGAGFIAHLALELGQPLTSLVNDGGGSTLVRQALARRPALLRNKRLVIWEFTERDIRFGIDGWQIVSLTRSNRTSR